MKRKKLNIKSTILSVLLLITLLCSSLAGCGTDAPKDTQSSLSTETESELATDSELGSETESEVDTSTETESETETETQTGNSDANANTGNNSTGNTNTGNDNTNTGNTNTGNNNAGNNTGNGNTTNNNTNNNSGSTDFNTPGITLSQIPAYSGTHYIVLNNNVPHFSTANLSNETFEYYSELDSLGRCGVAYAVLGEETMPADGEKRGSISSIKPTGWIQKQYDKSIVKQRDIYNRSHLIAWSLSAENANAKNLITGTPQLNQDTMTEFEDMVRDHINETGNHVAYRVTPYFAGNNLVATGVQMEAWSIEDKGISICFNVFIYNAQDGVIIDYATGESHAENESSSSETESQIPSTENTASGKYAVNGNNGTIHIVGACSATGTGNGQMANPIYFDTYEEALAYAQENFPSKYKNCGNCY